MGEVAFERSHGDYSKACFTYICHIIVCILVMGKFEIMQVFLPPATHT